VDENGKRLELGDDISIGPISCRGIQLTSMGCFSLLVKICRRTQDQGKNGNGTF